MSAELVCKIPYGRPALSVGIERNAKVNVVDKAVYTPALLLPPFTSFASVANSAAVLIRKGFCSVPSGVSVDNEAATLVGDAK